MWMQNRSSHIGRHLELHSYSSLSERERDRYIHSVQSKSLNPNHSLFAILDSPLIHLSRFWLAYISTRFWLSDFVRTPSERLSAWKLLLRKAMLSYAGETSEAGNGYTDPFARRKRDGGACVREYNRWSARNQPNLNPSNAAAIT